MSDYQTEQLESLRMVRRHLVGLSRKDRCGLIQGAEEYMAFRNETDAFQSEYFAEVCTASCYRNRLSACCSRDGIISFFADHVLNALVAANDELDRLEYVLTAPHTGYKCVYLSEEGCLWRLKPIVCEMFICDRARKQVFDKYPAAEIIWNDLKKKEKQFKWPDRPVLFDDLETIFITAGYRSSLMYLHTSPGLLRVKAKAGLA